MRKDIRVVDEAPKKKRWTARDVKTFDRIVALTDSIYQMDRIKGRLEYRHFESRFTKDELNEMWQKIKDKR
jgi:hypothetical protein